MKTSVVAIVAFALTSGMAHASEDNGIPVRAKDGTPSFETRVITPGSAVWGNLSSGFVGNTAAGADELPQATRPVETFSGLAVTNVVPLVAPRATVDNSTIK